MPRFSGGSAPSGEDSTRPSISMVPAVGSMKPAIMRKVVVLPQPDGPSSETNSPSLSARSSPATAAVPPKRFSMPRSASLLMSGPHHEIAADRAKPDCRDDQRRDQEDHPER